jgi:hypothetical protein
MTDNDDDDNDGSRELTVLICSANIGNAEPTPSSFAEWIPNDGELANPILSTKYPIHSTNYQTSTNDSGYTARVSNFIHVLEKEIKDTTGDRPPLNFKGKRKFDIIVLGMQEAAFVNKTPSSSTTVAASNNIIDSSATAARGKNIASTTTATTNVTPLTVINDSNSDDEEESTQSQDNNNNNIINEGALTNDNNNNISRGNVVTALTNGFLEISTTAKNSAKNTIRTVGRFGLLIRSLGLATRCPTMYKNPVLKKSTALLRKGGIGKIDPATIGSWGYDTRKFVQLITFRCPSYVTVSTSLRGQMRLVILAKKEISQDITNIHVEAENTGIGNVLANKGGIITTFTYRNTTRLSFMTAHLEAHEGEVHYQNRNKNLIAILGGAKTDPNYILQDASIISHHMFILGDLNYRTNLDLLTNNEKTKTKKKKKDVESVIVHNKDMTIIDNNDDLSTTEVNNISTQFEKAMALVNTKDWQTLYNADELSMALKKKDCLVGFTTLPCHFPPTFKVQRTEGYEYNGKRIPRYV